MKVVCDRSALLEAINLVAAVVPARTPSPHLSCVKITATKSAGGGELTLAGTDAETSLHITLTQVDVAKPGQAAVLADKLRQIVQAEEGEPTLTIELDGDQVHIRGENAHFRVFAFPVGDFPALPDFAAAVSGTGPETPRTVFTQSAGALQELVARTVFATARETSRYAINGVLLKRDGKKLEMVATDGRRLALSRTTLTSGGDKGTEPVSCIVPTKALNMFQKLVRNPDDSVRVAISDNRIYFAFDDGVPDSGGKAKAGDRAPRAVLTSILVEGTFPPYEDVIPRDQDKKITTDRDALTSAVRKAAVLTNEESRGVRMSFSSSARRLKLSSRAPEMGEAEIDIPLNSFTGEDIEISFNPAYISDVLKVMDAAEVMIELKATNKPGLIKCGSDFVYVLMPVNLPS